MTPIERPARVPWALPFFLAWSLWLSFPYFAFGPASYVKVHDCGDAILSARIYASTGGFGWWFAPGVCGTDGFAAALAGYIDAPLFFALPGWLAYGMLMWSVRLLAGYFTFRLLRDSLRLDPLPSFCGAILFSLFPQHALNSHWSGFSITDGLYLALMPLSLWGLHRADRLRPLAGAACAAGLGALYALSSAYNLTLFFLPGVFLWCLFAAPLAGANRWRLPAAFTLGWLAGAFPALWAGLANAPYSHRASWPVFRPLPGGGRNRTALAFGMLRDNAAPLAVAILAAIRARDRRIAVPAGAVVAALLCVLLYPMVRAAAYAHLGFFAGVQFDRFYLLIPFFAAVAGSAGLHCIGRGDALPRAWRKIPPSLRGMPALLLAALVAAQSAQICRMVLAERRGGSTYAALYLRPEIARIARGRNARSPFRVATVVGSLFHPSCAWAYGLESADGYLNLYPKRYHEFWGRVISPLTRSDGVRRAYFHSWGNRAYLFDPTGGFPGGRPVRFRDYYDLDLLSLANVKYLISPIALEDEDLVPLPAPPGAPAGGTPLFVYENRLAIPRFFLARAVVSCEGAEGVFRAMGKAGRDGLGATAFVERGECPGLSGGGGGVEVLRCGADRIELRTTAGAASLLVIANSFSPFWTARVDGAPARVIPADHAFQGVMVGPGTHGVVLEYRPPYARFFRDIFSLVRGREGDRG